MKGKILDMNNIKTEIPKAAAVVGGVIVGRFIAGQLDKIILSKPVGDLMGVEMQANVAKYVKPAIVALGGVAVMNYGKHSKNQYKDVIFNIGLGVAAYGASGVLAAVTNKSYLQGFGADEEYVMLDASGQKLSNLTGNQMKALLPDLEVSGIDGGTISLDEMEGLDGGFKSNFLNRFNRPQFQTATAEEDTDVDGIGNGEEFELVN